MDHTRAIAVRARCGFVRQTMYAVAAALVVVTVWVYAWAASLDARRYIGRDGRIGSHPPADSAAPVDVGQFDRPTVARGDDAPHGPAVAVGHDTGPTSREG